MLEPGCPTESELQRFNNGELFSESRIAQLGMHIDDCRRCQQRLKDLSPGRLQSRLRDAEPDEGNSSLEPPKASAASSAPASPPLPNVAAPQQTAFDSSQFELGVVDRTNPLFDTYLAEDVFLQQPVMLCVTRQQGHNQLDYQSQLWLDIQALAQLEHPNVLPVVRCGNWSVDQYYLVLAPVQHLALAQWLRSSALTLSLSRLLLILGQVAGALEYAHARQVLHRHLSPANIYLDGTGKVQVGFFGLFLDGRYQANLIETLPSPPAFAAPETIRNLPPFIDQRTDVYSLGRLLTELLTIADLNPAARETLGEIAHQCQRSSRSRRFQSVAEMKRAVFDRLPRRDSEP